VSECVTSIVKKLCIYNQIYFKNKSDPIQKNSAWIS